MSDPTPVKVSETCWCDADVTIEGATWEQATGYVIDWRATHQHREERERTHLGFASTGYVPTRNGHVR